MFNKKVQNIRKNLRKLFPETPLQYNHLLSKRYKADIYIKREDLTPVRSYKIRGAFNMISSIVNESSVGFQKQGIRGSKGDSKVSVSDSYAPEESLLVACPPKLKNFSKVSEGRDAEIRSLSGFSKFCCASAGNHSQGFAYTCKFFKVKGTIFMPVTTPGQKVEKTRAFGGQYVTIKLIGDTFDQANQAALKFAEASKAIMIPPFDHPKIIEGQATVAAEILDQVDGKKIDKFIMPVGGGGFSAGCSEFLKMASPETQLYVTEPLEAPSLHESFKKGNRVPLKTLSTFVDGAAVALIGCSNFEILQKNIKNEVLLVPENRLCSTLLEFLNYEGMVLEPAGALAIDALKNFDPKELEGQTIVCTASGGNFDFERLPDVKERAMKYEGLKKYLILSMPQRPGALKEFLSMLGPNDDIARFEYLKKSARSFGSVLLGLETNNIKNFEILFKKMKTGGFDFKDVTNDEVLADFLI